MFKRIENADRAAPTRRVAFTLIELLVTVGIITLLLTILVPALAQVRHQGKKALCGSNLHQLGIAVTMYLSTNNDSFWAYRWPEPGGLNWWFGFEQNGPNFGRNNRPMDRNHSILAPYLQNIHKTFACPAFPYEAGCYFPKFDGGSTSYGYNIHLAPLGPLPAQRSDRIKRPADVFVFADGAHFDFKQDRLNEPAYIQYTPNVNMASGYAHFRHADRANVLYIDSHVEAQPLRGQPYKFQCSGPAGNLTDPAGTNRIYNVQTPAF